MFNLLLFIFMYLIFVYVNIFNLNAVICYYLVYLFDFFGSSLFRWCFQSPLDFSLANYHA